MLESFSSFDEDATNETLTVHNFITIEVFHQTNLRKRYNVVFISTTNQSHKQLEHCVIIIKLQ